MKIILIDALGGEVSGSCYNVQMTQPRTLVDRGLFQGGKNSETLIAFANVNESQAPRQAHSTRDRLISKLPKMG